MIRTRKAFPYFGILPAAMLVIAISVFPFVSTVRLGFFKSSQSNERDVFVGLDNYISVIRDRLFYNALIHSFLFTITSVLGHMFIGIGLAILLDKKIPYKWFFRAFLLTPWLITSPVAAFVWSLIYHPQLGFLNALIKTIGLFTHDIQFLGDRRIALYSVIITNIWKSYSLHMVMYLAALQTVPREYYEAAVVDGANSFQRFMNISVPHLKNVILTVCLLDWIWTFRFFDLIYLMTQGGPGNSSDIIPTYLYRLGFHMFRFGYASAVASFIFIISLIPALLYIKYTITSERIF